MYTHYLCFYLKIKINLHSTSILLWPVLVSQSKVNKNKIRYFFLYRSFCSAWYIRTYINIYGFTALFKRFFHFFISFYTHTPSQLFISVCVHLLRRGIYYNESDGPPASSFSCFLKHSHLHSSMCYLICHTRVHYNNLYAYVGDDGDRSSQIGRGDLTARTQTHIFGFTLKLDIVI